MDELLAQLTAYSRGIWHRRWIGIAVAWLVALVGGAIVMQMPDRYEASARVYVDTQSVLRPLLSGLAVQPDIDQQLTILSRTLVSRPNVERLLRMSDMDLQVRSAVQKEEVILELQKNVKISSAGRDNLYSISYQDPAPAQAQRIVQSLLSIFVESGLGNKRQDADTARRFIEEQIKQYEKRLEEAENRLKEFRLKNLSLAGADGRDYFGRMSALSDALNAARLDLRAAEQSRDALKREVAGEEPVFLPETGAGAQGSPVVSELDVRIDVLKKNLDELLRRFTDQHPDVAGTRRILDQLEEERQKEIAARKPAAGSGPRIAAANPVIQQLKIALAESEANLAALRAKASELEARYRQLQAAARLQPEIEAEFAQLNRDYEIQKRQYEGLVSRRESAAISGEMDATAGVADFRVIDPPTVTQKPVAPKRLLLLPLAFVVALGAGIFASFVVSQIYPTIHDPRVLREVSGRPVLGSVSLLMTDANRRLRRRAHLAFAGALGGLLAVAGMTIALMVVSGRFV
ncbi:MAG: XrtA system polysaccharide chain length determinant [Candidatus Rokuibacteriota bacterium]